MQILLKEKLSKIAFVSLGQARRPFRRVAGAWPWQKTSSLEDVCLSFNRRPVQGRNPSGDFIRRSLRLSKGRDRRHMACTTAPQLRKIGKFDSPHDGKGNVDGGVEGLQLLKTQKRAGKLFRLRGENRSDVQIGTALSLSAMNLLAVVG